MKAFLLRIRDYLFPAFPLKEAMRRIEELKKEAATKVLTIKEEPADSKGDSCCGGGKCD